MHTVRVKPSYLTDSINPALFEPRLVEWIMLLDSRNLSSRIGSMTDCQPGYAFPSEQFADTGAGAPVVRIGDLDDSPLNTDSCVILASQFRGPENVHITKEACLVAMTGATIGKASYKASRSSIWLNQRVLALYPRHGYDIGFVFVCMLLPKVRQQIIAHASGAAQPNISDSQVASCVAPAPCAEVRSYIGDKVRQAERLRERARALECDFQRAVADTVPAVFGPIQETRKSSRAHAGLLDDRLNPGLFNPERLRIRTYLQERGGRLVSSIATIETPVTSNYQLQDPYLGLDGISSSSSMLSIGSVADDKVTGTVRVLPEGPAFGKLRPYLNKVCYVPPELAGCFGSTELLCIRPQDGIDGWYLYGALKLECTVRQLNPVSTGSTHPRVSREDVLEVMVPWHENHTRLGANLAIAQRCYFLAHRLTNAAKHLVEALIEAKITEANLKDAHDNREADRALLQRLTRKGIDVPNEPPLFPNLDDLHAALAETPEARE